MLRLILSKCVIALPLVVALSVGLTMPLHALALNQTQQTQTSPDKKSDKKSDKRSDSKNAQASHKDTKKAPATTPTKTPEKKSNVSKSNLAATQAVDKDKKRESDKKSKLDKLDARAKAQDKSARSLVLKEQRQPPLPDPKELAEQREQLRQRMVTLKQSLQKTESNHAEVADALSHTETAISDSVRRLQDYQQQQQYAENKLGNLKLRQTLTQGALGKQQQWLGNLLRQQYVSGGAEQSLSPFELILRGDPPNEQMRQWQWLNYVAQAQGQQMGLLQHHLQEITTLAQEVKTQHTQIQQLSAQQTQQNTQLQQQKSARQQQLGELRDKIQAQRQEVSTLMRDEARLGQLINEITRIIAERAAAEQAAREKARQAQLKKEQAAREALDKQRQAHLQREQELRLKQQRGNSVSAQEMAQIEQQKQALLKQEQAHKKEVERAAQQQTESSSVGEGLKNGYRLPVAGQMIGRFGQSRGGDQAKALWKGLFIRASAGASVHAIANGRVVFADWLRGFGNLIIVDHGQNTLSVYGNNEAVLKQVGERVQTGESIATVGNTGGNSETGLYFELRIGGKAVDPQSLMR
jgi:septal ring factor EnvC (AmiA/AmiB activator)